MALKPCPFCGNSAQFQTYHMGMAISGPGPKYTVVECMTCGANGPARGLTWNHRHDGDPNHAPVDMSDANT